MKIKIIGLGVIGVALLSAIVAYAADGTLYIKSSTYDHTGCKSTTQPACSGEGSCNVKVTVHWDCQGTATSACSPFDDVRNVAGSCTWVNVGTPQVPAWGCNCD